MYQKKYQSNQQRHQNNAAYGAKFYKNNNNKAVKNQNSARKIMYCCGFKNQLLLINAQNIQARYNGSCAWRSCNPGLISYQYARAFEKKHVIGYYPVHSLGENNKTRIMKIAVFTSIEVGTKVLKHFLTSEHVGSLTIKHVSISTMQTATLLQATTQKAPNQTTKQKPQKSPQSLRESLHVGSALRETHKAQNIRKTQPHYRFLTKGLNENKKIAELTVAERAIFIERIIKLTISSGQTQKYFFNAPSTRKQK